MLRQLSRQFNVLTTTRQFSRSWILRQSDLSKAKGLSSKVLSVPSSPVGPGASQSGEYKVPEYYSFNVMSYYEAEVELNPFRLPQQNAKKPLTTK